MPTGYTAELMGKGESFKVFVMRCARAMGACVTMRDSPSDDPIPDKFEVSDYHANELKKAQKELDNLLGKSPKEMLAYVEDLKKKEIKSNQEFYEKKLRENEKIDDMRIKVLRWIPPNSHKEFKDFMLQQLDVSKNDGMEWYTERIAEATGKTPQEYFQEKIKGKKESIKYHTKEGLEERDRVKKRNEWIRQLRDSLSACDL